jgi:excisionase family DNA binding protein
MSPTPTEIINPGEFNPNEWITTQEAAEITGYTTRNLTKMAKRGNIEAVKRGNMLFFRTNDIIRYAQLMQAMGKTKHTPKSKRQKAD